MYKREGALVFISAGQNVSCYVCVFTCVRTQACVCVCVFVCVHTCMCCLYACALSLSAFFLFFTVVIAAAVGSFSQQFVPGAKGWRLEGK